MSASSSSSSMSSPSIPSAPSSALTTLETGVSNVTHEIVPLTENTTALVVPKHVLANKKKRRAIVLDEDEYTSTLDHIIRRDFFPSTHTKSLSSQYKTKDSDLSTSKKPRLHYSACDLSLGSFLASHTSEDNASFDDLATLAINRRHARMWWFSEAQEKGDKYRLVAGNEERAGNLDSWKYKTKNELMFYPDTLPHKPKPTTATPQPTPTISYEATRFPGALYQTPITVTSSKPQTPISSTPRVAGYSYVRTPSPAITGNESPITTWGDVLGTPLHLTEEDVAALHVDEDGKKQTHIPGFHVRPTPKRDEIAWKLTEKHQAASRAKQAAARRQAAATARAGASPSLKSISPYQQKLHTAATLSPAAHRLLASKLGHTRTPSSNPLGDSLRQVYTPKRAPVPTFSQSTPSLHAVSPAPLTPSLATPIRTPKR